MCHMLPMPHLVLALGTLIVQARCPVGLLHSLHFAWKLMKASMEAFTASMEVEAMEAVDASMKASMEASIEVASTKASLEVTFTGAVSCSHEHGGYYLSFIREFHNMLVRDSCIRRKRTVSWPDVSRHNLPWAVTRSFALYETESGSTAG